MAVKGFLISEAWAKRVDETIRRDAATFLAKSSPAPSRFYDLRPVRLQTSWASSGGIYKATARFIKDDGTVDNSTTIDVYAPTLTSSPTNHVAGSTRFDVVWRGRWEYLGEKAASSARYTGSDYIMVSGAAGPDGYPIYNTGMTNARLVTRGTADSYSDHGTLYLSGAFFKWVSSTLDIVGKKELWLNTAVTRVVTGVTSDGNGGVNVTTADIRHLVY